MGLRERANGMPAGGWPCGDEPVMAGDEGLHVFDVGDPTSPQTSTRSSTCRAARTPRAGVPDPANGRLIVYSTPSNGKLGTVSINIEIPIDDPESAFSYHHFEPSADLIACHDTGVVLGDVLKAACAGGQGFALWSMAEEDGGSLIDPALLDTLHNQAWFDGVIINTGGTLHCYPSRRLDAHLRPRAERRHVRPLPGDGHPARQRHLPGADGRHEVVFLLRRGDSRPGPSGPGRAPSPRSRTARCKQQRRASKKRDILVHGSDQSGIASSTSPREDIQEIAYADPKPLNPNAFTVAGDWSSPDYNGVIYESDITRGLFAGEIGATCWAAPCAWTA